MNRGTHYYIFRLIEQNPRVTQREMARAMGISLGKVNYCLRGLIERDLLEAVRVSGRRSGSGFSYRLTPRGAREKSAMLALVLRDRLDEYEAIKTEIASLRQELSPK